MSGMGRASPNLSPHSVPDANGTPGRRLVLPIQFGGLHRTRSQSPSKSHRRQLHRLQQKIWAASPIPVWACDFVRPPPNGATLSGSYTCRGYAGTVSGGGRLLPVDSPGSRTLRSARSRRSRASPMRRRSAVVWHARHGTRDPEGAVPPRASRRDSVKRADCTRAAWGRERRWRARRRAHKRRDTRRSSRRPLPSAPRTSAEILAEFVTALGSAARIVADSEMRSRPWSRSSVSYATPHASRRARWRWNHRPASARGLRRSSIRERRNGIDLNPARASECAQRLGASQNRTSKWFRRAEPGSLRSPTIMRTVCST